MSTATAQTAKAPEKKFRPEDLFSMDLLDTKVYGELEITRVPGGWLFRLWDWDKNHTREHSTTMNHGGYSAPAFVPYNSSEWQGWTNLVK